jgi:hypothetical protein
MNRSLSAEQARIAELQHRIRVIDIELASWKPPPPPKEVVSRRGMNAGGVAFFAGFLACVFLGKLIAAVIGR